MARKTPDKRMTAPPRGQAEPVILEVAKAAFVEQGFAKTSVAQIARRAGVTTGALYHHFGSKEGLYREVIACIARSVGERAQAAMGGVEGPHERLVAAVEATLDACLEDDVRLAYTEAHTVLGLEAWRELEAEQTQEVLAQVLLPLVRPEQAPFFAPIIKGAIVEGAMAIVTADDPHAARAVVGEGLRTLLAGLTPA